MSKAARLGWTAAVGVSNALALFIVALAPTPGAAYTLPPPNPAYSVQFGDFTVYSTPFLNLFFTGDQKGDKNANFILPSAPGTIQHTYLIVGTGPAGALDNTDVLGGVNKGDDAFETFNTAGKNFANEDTNSAPFCGAVTASCIALTEPGGAAQFPGDSANTWDIPVNNLLAYLNGGSMIFFFNQNQNRGGDTENEDIFAWALVTLEDTTGKNASKTFELTNGPVDGALTQPFVDRNNAGEFIFSPGDMCVDPNAPFATLHFGPCDKNDPAGSITISHNLGANDAAFAVTSSALDTALHSGDFNVMHVRFAFGDANNGFEQIFIISTTTPTVSNVASLVLLALGAVTLVIGARWRARGLSLR